MGTNDSNRLFSVFERGDLLTGAPASQSPWQKTTRPDRDQGLAIVTAFRASTLAGRKADPLTLWIRDEARRTGLGLRHIYQVLAPDLQHKYSADEFVDLYKGPERRTERPDELTSAIRQLYDDLPDKDPYGAKPSVEMAPSVVVETPSPVVVDTPRPIFPEKSKPQVVELPPVQQAEFCRMLDAEIERTGAPTNRKLYNQLPAAVQDKYTLIQMIKAAQLEARQARSVPGDLADAVLAAYGSLPDYAPPVAPASVARPRTQMAKTVLGKAFATETVLPVFPKWNEAELQGLPPVDHDSFAKKVYQERARTGLPIGTRLYGFLPKDVQARYNLVKLTNSCTKAVPLRWVPGDLARVVLDIYAAHPDRTPAPATGALTPQ